MSIKNGGITILDGEEELINDRLLEKISLDSIIVVGHTNYFCTLKNTRMDFPSDIMPL
jgi:hypothetical protein